MHFSPVKEEAPIFLCTVKATTCIVWQKVYIYILCVTTYIAAINITCIGVKYNITSDQIVLQNTIQCIICHSGKLDHVRTCAYNE